MLGITLAPSGQVPGAYPYEVGYSYGGNGVFMCPDDPGYNQRGEAGFYHDTQLGMVYIPRDGILKRLVAKMFKKKQLGSIPSDMELAATYGYQPQMTGWIDTKAGQVQTSWIPPNGWQAAPFRGLGDAAPPDITAVYNAMNTQNQKMFTLSVITTIAVAVSAVVAIARNTSAIKKETRG